jgi:hypothetical protein
VGDKGGGWVNGVHEVRQQSTRHKQPGVPSSPPCAADLPPHLARRQQQLAALHPHVVGAAAVHLCTEGA